MNQRPTILFLCTGNSCRSQMAEGLLRKLDADRFKALSAGSHPAGFVHPLAMTTMHNMGIDLSDATSKSWDEYKDTSMDAVITVCDNAAGETCPVWTGSPLVAHWSLPDPSFYPGSQQERLDFCSRVAQRLRTKLEGLIALDWSLGRAELSERLKFLGEI